MLTGSCLCGDIAFEIDGPVDHIGHCHCSMCRKSHGAAFATFGVAAPEDFHWRQGEDKVVHYRSTKTTWRNFCPRCGSGVPACPPGGPFAIIPLGNVAEDPVARPELHFFAGAKAPWHNIVDDLPQHEAWPPQFGPDAVIVERPVRTARTPGATGGSCLCGAVTFEYDGEPAAMVNCHCSRCRRAMSAAYATMIMVGHDTFRWLSGEDQVVNYKMPEARVKGTAFCQTCGSQVPRRRDEANMQIPAGCLDDDPKGRARANIFTDSKAAWSVLDDSLPGFPEAPGV